SELTRPPSNPATTARRPTPENVYCFGLHCVCIGPLSVVALNRSLHNNFRASDGPVHLFL
ncbi:hypothetical protein ACV356_29000, partial [Pseudomonas aeruginosa]